MNKMNSLIEDETQDTSNSFNYDPHEAQKSQQQAEITKKWSGIIDSQTQQSLSSESSQILEKQNSETDNQGSDEHRKSPLKGLEMKEMQNSEKSWNNEKLNEDNQPLLDLN